jgi:hypothetical protein
MEAADDLETFTSIHTRQRDAQLSAPYRVTDGTINRLLAGNE